MDREAGLADLERARGEFETAMAGVPDAALGHLKAGDDYSLSGLVPHCEYVFRHYSAVLDGMAAGAQFRAVDPDELDEWHQKSSREGFTAADRKQSMAALGAWHLATVQRLRRVPDWEATVPVMYGADTDEPYPTSAADVNGWLTDHYREHVPHVSELLADWRGQGAGAGAEASKPA